MEVALGLEAVLPRSRLAELLAETPIRHVLRHRVGSDRCLSSTRGHFKTLTSLSHAEPRLLPSHARPYPELRTSSAAICSSSRLWPVVPLVAVDLVSMGRKRRRQGQQKQQQQQQQQQQLQQLQQQEQEDLRSSLATRIEWYTFGDLFQAASTRSGSATTLLLDLEARKRTSDKERTRDDDIDEEEQLDFADFSEKQELLCSGYVPHCGGQDSEDIEASGADFIPCEAPGAGLRFAWQFDGQRIQRHDVWPICRFGRRGAGLWRPMCGPKSAQTSRGVHTHVGTFTHIVWPICRLGRRGARLWRPMRGPIAASATFP